MMAKVGKPAPDFEASAFVDGGFDNIKLSDYKGKWVVLCFYPGDFTFVWPTELTAGCCRIVSPVAKHIRPTKSLKIKKYVGPESPAYSGDSNNRILLYLGMSSLKVTEVRCKNALVKSIKIYINVKQSRL
jgi:hypothetical protein